MTSDFQVLNCIMVYDADKNHLLFCRRTKDPYLGLLNFVGGKVEPGETGIAAAYRELKEETGICQEQIHLSHMMDFTYYNQRCKIEIYVGFLKENVTLTEEQHPLVWMGLHENFFDMSRFAGEGNIGHMIEQVKRYGTGE